jgi:hypothetical protein
MIFVLLLLSLILRVVALIMVFVTVRQCNYPDVGLRRWNVPSPEAAYFPIHYLVIVAIKYVTDGAII